MDGCGIVTGPVFVVDGDDGFFEAESVEKRETMRDADHQVGKKRGLANAELPREGAKVSLAQEPADNVVFDKVRTVEN